VQGCVESTVFGDSIPVATSALYQGLQTPAIHDCVWWKIRFPKVPSTRRAQILARYCFVHSAAATYLKNVPTLGREPRRSESMYSMVKLPRTPMFCAVCMFAGWESSHRLDEAAVLNQHSGNAGCIFAEPPENHSVPSLPNIPLSTTLNFHLQWQPQHSLQRRPIPRTPRHTPLPVERK
jgi:hypothetical protein